MCSNAQQCSARVGHFGDSNEYHCLLREGHVGDHEYAINPKDLDVPGYRERTPADVKVNQTTHAQRAVFERSMEIFMERTLEHGELWRTVEPTDTAHHIRHKAHRIYFAARRLEAGEGSPDQNRERLLDSALDCINYCAFIVRQIEGDDNEPA